MGYKSVVGLYLPIEKIEKVEDFRKRYKTKTRSAAIEEILDLGLFVESKLGLVESIPNEDLETLREQIESGQIVDYVSRMDLNKFRILVDIMKTEEKARLG